MITFNESLQRIHQENRKGCLNQVMIMYFQKESLNIYVHIIFENSIL